MLTKCTVSRHVPGSANGVLLSKWLGDNGADVMASMVGSESMTSSDWMLLALSSVGHDSQRKVGEAFVQRLLEKGDVHPAVAILLGLSEQNEAIEVYASRQFYMEAVLLTCLVAPGDWPRQSYLVRKWGEVAVAQGMPELAVRCFSCTSLEATAVDSAPTPWSPSGSQDSEFAGSGHQGSATSVTSPPLSPPSAGSGPGSMTGRMSVKNSSLKLITSFGNKTNEPQLLSTGDSATPRLGAGVTPIAESAISPGGVAPWSRSAGRPTRQSGGSRDPSSARTATPGAFRRKKLPSKAGSSKDASSDATPLANIARARGFPNTPNGADDGAPPLTSSSYATSESDASSYLQEPGTVRKSSRYRRNEQREMLPSPSEGVFKPLTQQDPRIRNGSRDRKPTGLHVSIHDTVEVGARRPKTTARSVGASSISGSELYSSGLPTGGYSPLVTGESSHSLKNKSIDRFIDSLEEANNHQSSRQRGISQTRSDGRSRKKIRDPSKSRLDAGPRIIRPARRSPSSPAPMSPEETARYREAENYDDERYYQVTSPTESRQGRIRHASQSLGTEQRRAESPDKTAAMGRSGSRVGDRVISRNASRQVSPEGLRPSNRGRSQQRSESSLVRSPSSPLPMSLEARFYKDDEDDVGKEPTRSRQPSRQRSTSRRAGSRARSIREDLSPERSNGRASSRIRSPPETMAQRLLTRKELAARELEERRLSLARRPSAPSIPHPGELSAGRPPNSGRSFTEAASQSPVSGLVPVGGISRSQSVDPETLNRSRNSSKANPIYSAESLMRSSPKANTGTSTSSVPIGLPATPRAMRHPRYMSADPKEEDNIPAVPEIPNSMSNLSLANQAEADQDNDEIVPLLPSTVYGQKSPPMPTRSASVPLEHVHNGGNWSTAQHTNDARRTSGSRSGVRKVSPNDPSNKKYTQSQRFTASIDETLHDNQVVVVDERSSVLHPAPPLLAELQHLAGPPPPPPPPAPGIADQEHRGASDVGNLGVINIVMDERGTTISPPAADNSSNLSVNTAAMNARATTASPPLSASTQHSLHRRGRSNVSEHSLGSRIRNAAERMRSSSKSRAISPPIEQSRPAPYESILPALTYGQTNASAVSIGSPPHNANAIPPPPPPPPSAASGQPMEQVIGPDQTHPKGSGPGSSGYRNPKEIRANMPPDQLQLGAVPQQIEGGMI